MPGQETTPIGRPPESSGATGEGATGAGATGGDALSGGATGGGATGGGETRGDATTENATGGGATNEGATGGGGTTYVGGATVKRLGLGDVLVDGAEKVIEEGIGALTSNGGDKNTSMVQVIVDLDGQKISDAHLCVQIKPGKPKNACC